MASRCLVINEWLFHDLQGHNQPETQLETAEFLQKLIDGPDRIAVLRDSAWMNKAYQLMKSDDFVIRELAKLLNCGLLLNSSNCQFVELSEVLPLPKELNQIDLKEDQYLFETYFAANADLIVTSDERLCDKVASVESVKLVLRNEFLKDYPN